MDPTGLNDSAFEVSGLIKWFDIAKGYGFIKPSVGPQGDVLLHQTCVRQSGFKAAYEGARVVCEAVQGPKGLQARRLLSLDNSTATPQVVKKALHRAVEPVTGDAVFVTRWETVQDAQGNLFWKVWARR